MTMIIQMFLVLQQATFQTTIALVACIPLLVLIDTGTSNHNWKSVGKLSLMLNNKIQLTCQIQ